MYVTDCRFTDAFIWTETIGLPEMEGIDASDWWLSLYGRTTDGL